MKRVLLISFAILALHAAPAAGDGWRAFNLLLAGGPEANVFRIWLTPNGRSYVIDSNAPLEVGWSGCVNPEGKPEELVCSAPAIGSFEVNAAGGDDTVEVSPSVAVPVTLRGGGGRDVLIGGGGPDMLVGGGGNDRLVGRGGSDLLCGGPGNDVLIGGPGNDVLIGGPGNDVLRGGPGRNTLIAGSGARRGLQCH